ncbi:NAD-glutamate dehydrogenase [Acidimicrobiaceae bacterium AH-315-P05]|nr:NAD-glutamate dehydrogenase [Acidimicrobiaceae bacterium AH-315-P05]
MAESVAEAAREMVGRRAEQRGDSPDDGGPLEVKFYDAMLASLSDGETLGAEPAEGRQDSVEHLAGAAMAALRAATQRPTGTDIVRVYNPVRLTDGWEANRTVIDVISDNRPFIVDSLLVVLENFGLRVHRVSHPLVAAIRTDGVLVDIAGEAGSINAADESLVHIEVERISSKVGLEELQNELESAMGDVRLAVDDWRAMRAKALLAADLIFVRPQAPDGVVSGEVNAETTTHEEEVAELLRWMESGAFTFIGYREYDVEAVSDDVIRVQPRPGTGLGVMRDTDGRDRELVGRPLGVESRAILTKANSRSTVHRGVPLDYIGIREVDDAGNITGERRFIGLFTSELYASRVTDIPLVRLKVAKILAAAGDGPSHQRSTLLHTLQAYPRDELLQAPFKELAPIVRSVAANRDRHRVTLHVRHGLYGRFVSCLVHVPRDRFDTSLRLQIQDLLAEAYNADSVSFSTEISGAALARLHVVLGLDSVTPMPEAERPDPARLEAEIALLIQTWDEVLWQAVAKRDQGDEDARKYAKFVVALPDSYRTRVAPVDAVADLAALAELDTDSIDVRFASIAPNGAVRCTILRHGEPMSLSSLLPQFHDLGAEVIDERPHMIEIEGEDPRHVYDLGLLFDHESAVDDAALDRARDGLLATWQGLSNTDELASLMITAGLDWRQVAVLRAYCRYLVQIDSRFSLTYVIATVAATPDLASHLAEWFAAKFDPTDSAEDSSSPVETSPEQTSPEDQLRAAIDGLSSLDADRMFRVLADLVGATTRTSAWLEPDRNLALAFKFDPSRIAAIPAPVPHAEIFVSCPVVEGVHMRFGPVARGGLRWSDRPEDVRTEVLGLVKAQAVKNAVIVPVGAKGGFIARQLPVSGERSDVAAEVLRAYRMFIGALLDLTDNRVGDAVVGPAKVRRLDGEDPYLVVAADKGTATFSDEANALAADRGFWLDDAFASGGSAGYDHKALAITARGAWVSVAHHFLQKGVDVQADPIVTVGIGDMSGDVFGNGMLSSQTICLVAAFDHRHVFLDPNPDAGVSFVERQRLFDLPRSSWAEYDTSLISEGGGVHARTAKQIPITTQVRDSLGIDADVTSLTPDELLSAILKSPVDLLWNGGIGTYVKSSEEQQSAAGDRANDGLRVDGAELRCRAVGEGGNLGFTQRGRIEAANHGVAINTDAIDNSGGVDCSDREVNLKILLAVWEASGRLDRATRNEWMAEDSDEVCDQVLATNSAQNEVLTLAAISAPGMTDVHSRLLGWLESRAGLDRELEALPSDSMLADMGANHRGLSRPELAVLLAYVKNQLAVDLSVAPEGMPSLAEDPTVLAELDKYPPSVIAEHTEGLIREHPLRDALLATVVANDLVNRGGISMVHRLIEETSASAHEVARAHLAAWYVFGLSDRSAQIRALDGIVDAATQARMRSEIKRLGERATRWFLRHERQPIDVGAVVSSYQESVGALFEMVNSAHDQRRAEVAFQLAASGDDGGGGLNDDIDELDRAFGFLDLVDVAARTGASLRRVATVSAAVESELSLDLLRHRIVELPRDDHWQTLARGALRDEFYREHAEITAVAVACGDNNEADGGAAVSDENGGDISVDTDRANGENEHAAWLATYGTAIRRFVSTLEEIEGADQWDLSGVSVAVRAMSVLGRTASRQKSSLV